MIHLNVNEAGTAFVNHSATLLTASETPSWVHNKFLSSVSRLKMSSMQRDVPFVNYGLFQTKTR